MDSKWENINASYDELVGFLKEIYMNPKIHLPEEVCLKFEELNIASKE